MFKFTGAVKAIFDTQQVTEKFAKRELVVTDTTSMYPQDILFQLTQDKCNLADGIKENDMIEVSFNLRGREWISPQGEKKYFNTLEAWRIERLGQGNQPAGMPQGGPSAMEFAPQASASTSPMESSMTSEEDSDDLPF